MKWQETVGEFERHLYYEEKAELTIQKYLRDVRRFLDHMGEREITKDLVLEYKRDLKEQYQISSINSMLAAVNLFLEFAGLGDCKVRQYRTQKLFFCGKKRGGETKSDHADLMQHRAADQRAVLCYRPGCEGRLCMCDQ